MRTLPQLANLSVAMCTYNGERHLQEQLDTIATQTRLPIELVVCDDQSTDATVAMLEAFAKRAPFPVHIHRNGTRLGSTRNFDQAIRMCNGTYIALCDQDDRWLPTKLKTLGDVLDSDSSIGMVFSDAFLIDSNSKLITSTLWKELIFPEAVRRKFTREPEVVLAQRPVVTGATMLFRKELLQRFSTIPSTWVHDGWIAWMSVFWLRPTFVMTPLTEYRTHAAQQLGVGNTSRLARLQTIRSKQRSVYANAAVEFTDLLRYVQITPALDSKWSSFLLETVAFFRLRAESPKEPLRRAWLLLRSWRSYQRFYGRVLYPLVRDLLMQ